MKNHPKHYTTKCETCGSPRPRPVKPMKENKGKCCTTCSEWSDEEGWYCVNPGCSGCHTFHIPQANSTEEKCCKKCCSVVTDVFLGVNSCNDISCECHANKGKCICYAVPHDRCDDANCVCILHTPQATSAVKDGVQAESWEDDFDEIFSTLQIVGDRQFEEFLPYTYKNVKAHISSLIEQEKQRAVEEYKERLAAKVKKLKLIEAAFNSEHLMWKQRINMKLDTVISFIREEK